MRRRVGIGRPQRGLQRPLSGRPAQTVRARSTTFPPFRLPGRILALVSPNRPLRRRMMTGCHTFFEGCRISPRWVLSEYACGVSFRGGRQARQSWDLGPVCLGVRAFAAGLVSTLVPFGLLTLVASSAFAQNDDSPAPAPVLVPVAPPGAVLVPVQEAPVSKRYVIEINPLATASGRNGISG
jgi:hypothetical protein